VKRLVLCLGVVAALAFSVASASAVTAGRYTGHTADKRAVSFRVSGHRVRSFAFQARWRCDNGTGFVTHATFKAIKIRGRRFSGAFATHSGALATTIRGTFKGRGATGTIRRRAHFDSHRKLAPGGKLTCSVNTRFKAHRA
jgi:hypothetical protein